MVTPTAATSNAYKLPESVLVVIHTSALEVLLLERADAPGFWQSVTGSRLDDAESLVQTCVREVHEETGIDIGREPVPASCLVPWHQRNRYEIYARWRHRYAPGVSHNTEHVFDLTVPPGTVVTLSAREHLSMLWLPWEQAAERCFSPSNAQAIRRLPDVVAQRIIEGA